jgi:hypothetical protein
MPAFFLTEWIPVRSVEGEHHDSHLKIRGIQGGGFISGATAAVCGARAGVVAAALLEVADLLRVALPTTPQSGTKADRCTAEVEPIGRTVAYRIFSLRFTPAPLIVTILIRSGVKPSCSFASPCTE